MEIINKKFISIEGVLYEVLHEFSILHKGWELDYTGYIIKHDGEYKAIWSDHGTLYHEKNAKDMLSDLISFYKEGIKETEMALNLLKEK